MGTTTPTTIEKECFFRVQQIASENYKEQDPKTVLSVLGDFDSAKEAIECYNNAGTGFLVDKALILIYGQETIVLETTF